MYYWAHSEAPASVPQTPGRLSSIAWPPTPASNTDVFFANDSLQSPKTPERPPSSASGAFERFSSARSVEIMALEEEINRLKQEVEKYKTLTEIQLLTAKAVKDFGSPVEEDKSFLCKICGNCVNKLKDSNGIEPRKVGTITVLT